MEEAAAGAAAAAGGAAGDKGPTACGWSGISGWELAIVARVPSHREARQLSPVCGLHLPAKLAERIEYEPIHQRLNSIGVFGSVAIKHARNSKPQLCGRPNRRRDTGRLLALPVRIDHQVEAGLGAIGLANLGDPSVPASCRTSG